VTSAQPGVQPAVWAEANPVFAFFQQTTAIAEIELKKLIRDPTEVLARAVQPVLWIVVFGNVFSRVRAIPTGNVSYLSFMTPGILAQSVLFVAIFYGIAVIWERDLGIVHKLLVSPAQRAALVYGKAASAGFRGAIQATIIYAVAALLRIQIRWSPLSIAGVFAGAMLGSAIFATMSFIVACIVKSRERFMGVGQLMTMPLFFASNAIYPISIMPHWLRIVAYLNPLTYLVDALRSLMIGPGQSSHSIAMNFGIVALIFVIFAAIGTKLYPSLVR
jgi:ABC-2 type transport system permease protein